MNTIHSSSLAFYPVGYNQPQTGRVDSNRVEKAKLEGDVTTGIAQNKDLPKASSIEQITAALAENGLAASNNDNQPTNSKTLKALNAYTDNRNQPAQLRVSEIISGIDLYA